MGAVPLVPENVEFSTSKPTALITLIPCRLLFVATTFLITTFRVREAEVPPAPAIYITNDLHSKILPQVRTFVSTGHYAVTTRRLDAQTDYIDICSTPDVQPMALLGPDVTTLCVVLRARRVTER